MDTDAVGSNTRFCFQVGPIAKRNICILRPFDFDVAAEQCDLGPHVDRESLSCGGCAGRWIVSVDFNRAIVPIVEYRVECQLGRAIPIVMHMCDRSDFFVSVVIGRTGNHDLVTGLPVQSPVVAWRSFKDTIFHSAQIEVPLDVIGDR